MSVSKHVLWISCLTHENFVKNEQIKSRKNFPVNLSPDKPETGFLFFRVVEEILFFLFSFIFSFITVWMHFPPAKAKSQSKQVEYVFSLRKPLSACKPGKSDKSEVTNSVFSGHSSKAEKSIFFLRKSARNCPPAKAVRSQKSVKTAKSVYVEKKDSSSKIFQYKSVSFFPFQLCPLTTEAMGLGGLRANFLSQ